MQFANTSITLNPKEDLTNFSDYLSVKEYTFNDSNYTIIRYKKEKLNEIKNNLPEGDNKKTFDVISKYRSVIIRDDKIIVYSPSKSIPYERFITTNKVEESWLEDFIDGTMINVFFDTHKNEWEITTRSTIGGNILFFNDIKNYEFFNINDNLTSWKNTTFRTMFFEACNVNNFNLNTLPKEYNYTFVLQHPFNRIVTPVMHPAIFLVRVYKITNNINTSLVNIEKIDVKTFFNEPPYIFLNTGVKMPGKYPISSFSDISNIYTQNPTPFHCVGCMIYSTNGDRTKIRNQNYEHVRKLRGNQPKLQYTYLCLKKENKVTEYLHYYPEHVLLFKKFRTLMHTYTYELYLNYISCFIRKEKQLKNYDFEYKNHMYHIHEEFKNNLRPTGKFVDKKVVIDYVNNLHPAQQMFVINYRTNTNNSNDNENLNKTREMEVN